MAFGTPSGDIQDQWPLIFVLNHIHFGMNLQEAIDPPAWNSSDSSDDGSSAPPHSANLDPRSHMTQEFWRRGQLLNRKEGADHSG